MKRTGSEPTKRLKRSATMGEVIGFRLPPALAAHLARLAMERVNANDGGDMLPLSMDFFEASDKDNTQRFGAFNAPISTTDPKSLSQLRVTLRNVPECECSVSEGRGVPLNVSGKLCWNATFDASADEEINKLPKPQFGTKVKKKEIDLITHQDSTLKEEAISKRLLSSDSEPVRRARSSSAPASRRGRGRATASSQRTSRARSPVVPASSFMNIPSPISDPSSSSSIPAAAPWANRDTEPRLSTLRMPITSRDDYDRCCAAFDHFSKRAIELRRKLLDEHDDAQTKLRKLDNSDCSSTEMQSLVEDVQRNRERVSSVGSMRTELRDLTEALMDGKRRLQQYANGPV